MATFYVECQSCGKRKRFDGEDEGDADGKRVRDGWVRGNNFTRPGDLHPANLYAGVCGECLRKEPDLRAGFPPL
jgi:hypothetical protein